MGKNNGVVECQCGANVVNARKDICPNCGAVMKMDGSVFSRVRLLFFGYIDELFGKKYNKVYRHYMKRMVELINWCSREGFLGPDVLRGFEEYDEKIASILLENMIRIEMAQQSEDINYFI